MKKVTEISITVTAPPDTVLRYASDPAFLAEWNNEYIGCIECCRAPAKGDAKTVSFCGTACRGGGTKWELTLTRKRPGDEGITQVDARIMEETGIRYYRRWPRVFTKRQREAMIRQSLVRMKGFAESECVARQSGSGLGPSDMVALLNVYTSQFGSFTTLLWQVPALGLTAQAFLMTIVLGIGSPISHGARYAASALSIIIALASIQLMHDQRARAINHAELAKRTSYRLSLTNLLGGSFGLGDAVPHEGADAQNVWATNRFIYGIWVACMLLFAITDVFVIISFGVGISWFAVHSS
jgi:hypothetical protein